MAESTVTVHICWGCNAQRWPAAWLGFEQVLIREGRVRWVETLCGRGCMADRIAEGKTT